MTSVDDLDNYFENKQDMKAYCSVIAGKNCIKCKSRDNGNYYKIHCSEPNCQYQITFNYRSSDKFKKGFYLVLKGTCLNHKINCPNMISNLCHTKNAKFISKQILPLFEEKSPSLVEIKNSIKCFNEEEFSESELKYIKKLAKKQYFKGSTTAISQLVQFCNELISKHNWKFDIQFIEGMITSLILFTPWAENLLKYFCNPLIVDATFSIENLRFISAVVIDGEWQTQVIGLVIRGTEDSKGYSLLFQFVSKIIGNKIITIMADMARCIQKAANDCFISPNLVFCFYHFKQNYLKHNKFIPSEEIWLIFQQYMKGEVSEKLLRDKWCEEESNVDIELKGYEYISKMAIHFAPNESIHKRGIVSSQRIEMLNNLIKKNGNSAFEMLRQFFHVAQNWFEKSATISYPQNKILTNYAEDLLEKIIKDEFVVEKFDLNLHYKRNNIECGCFFGNDLGIPCPFTIRLLRKKIYSEKNEKENEDLLNVSFIHDQNLIKMISPEWLISTQKEAFKPLINQTKSLYEIISLKSDEDLNVEKLDILAAKIRWLYQTSEKYREKVDRLLNDANEEIVFPFFDIKTPKKKQKKRKISSLEKGKCQKENDEIIDILTRHFNSEKITRANLLSLADNLIQANAFLPRLKKASSKDEISNWFRCNWNVIKPALGVCKCIAPDGSEVSENEDELYLLNDDSFNDL